MVSPRGSETHSGGGEHRPALPSPAALPPACLGPHKPPLLLLSASPSFPTPQNRRGSVQVSSDQQACLCQVSAGGILGPSSQVHLSGGGAHTAPNLHSRPRCSQAVLPTGSRWLGTTCCSSAWLPLIPPSKLLLGLDARPQHVLPLDHIWMFLDELPVIRQYELPALVDPHYGHVL